MIYGYARVSTRGQAADGNSLTAQTEALKAAGAEVVFADAFTGTKAHRPELDKLMEALQPGDRLIAVKLDRIARSAVQGIELIDGLLDKGVTVHILNMGLMDNSPTGKLIRTVMLAFAQFERDQILERTAEGKALARLKPDFAEGRPPKYNEKQLAHAVELLGTHSYGEVVKLTGISKSTLVRERRKRKP